jgi:hypothetical protein
VGGANAHKEKQTFPKSFPPKSSAFAFLHLTLSARSARGTAKPHWLSLEGGKESQCENPSKNLRIPMVVSIYSTARTYFQSQSD